MKTIEMLRTEVCENASGARQVFGPAGKVIPTDDGTAAVLIKSGAAQYADPDGEPDAYLGNVTAEERAPLSAGDPAEVSTSTDSE